MNNTSQCIFDISHVARNVRDTLQFILPNELTVQVFDQRKNIIAAVLNENSFIGKFVKQNEEKLGKFIEEYREFLDTVYGDDSTILTKTSEGKIRVDHTQDLAIVKFVVDLTETLRDILFSHVQFARNSQATEESILKLIDADERFDRTVKIYFLVQLYQKSFNEFQKVVGESKGQATPQSQFIVNNELSVIAARIRSVREHARVIDNKTLDKLDKAVELTQMCEGRRERRDGRSFPDLFQEVITTLGQYLGEVEPAYNNLYNPCLQDMLKTIEEQKASQGEGAKA